MVFFTEERPDEKIIGTRRHWFSKPASKGFKLPGVGDSQSNFYSEQKLNAANQRANAFVINNENMVPVIKRIHDQCKGVGSSSDLFSAFRMNDEGGRGTINKDDFINVVFDQVRGVKPSDLMQLVTAFAEQDDQEVKYEDFMHLI